MNGVVKMKNKNPNTQIPESQVKLRPGAVVAKETERERVCGLFFENNPSAVAAGWPAVDGKLTQPKVDIPCLIILVC